jgi:nucleotide-binding universal stress UspA family protein
VIKKILVPTDGSGHAKRAVEFASDLASNYGAALHLMHVLSLGHLESLAGRSYGGGAVESIKDLARKAGETILREAEEEAKRNGVERVETTLCEGDPANEILQFASTNHVDMIVMGRRGVGGVESLFLGSVSHKVAILADCICVTVK